MKRASEKFYKQINSMDKLKSQKFALSFFLALFFITAVALSGNAQYKDIDNKVVSFKKHEYTYGVIFEMLKDREELLTTQTKWLEERTLFSGKYRFQNRFQKLLDYKQEDFLWNINFGAIGGKGTWLDSSNVKSSMADHTLYGIRTSLNVKYLNRFYYDSKNYTIMDIGTWGRYDVLKNNSEGIGIDSVGVKTNFNTNELDNRVRFGFSVKAGWGVGRLSPMNHLMIADYFLHKYYPGRVFSEYEIARFAQKIASIKHRRNIKTAYAGEKELQEIYQFLKSNMLLAPPQALEQEWQYGEFEPRYQGQRIEAGPHFKYYNQEPDFIYGGYVTYENSEYKNIKWNRNFGLNVMYSRYKKQDWVTAEINLGWSRYLAIKSQFDFGLKYVPGIEINGFENIGNLSHSIIPYVAYFSQLSRKTRLKLNFAWRIADGKQFVLPGPEFSVALYRSKQ